MKHNKYLITFITGKTEIVYAFGQGEATILAQANQINKGNNYTVTNIEKIG